MELLSRQKLDAFLSIIGKFRIFKGKSAPSEVTLPPETTSVAATLPVVNAKDMPLTKNVDAYFGHVKWTKTQAEEPISAPLSLGDSPESVASLAPEMPSNEPPLAPPAATAPLPQVSSRPVTGTVNAFFSAVAWSGKPASAAAGQTLETAQTMTQPQNRETAKPSAYGLVGGVQDYFSSISWTGSTGAPEQSTVAVLERPAPQEEESSDSDDFFGDVSWD